MSDKSYLEAVKMPLCTVLQIQMEHSFVASWKREGQSYWNPGWTIYKTLHFQEKI